MSADEDGRPDVHADEALQRWIRAILRLKVAAASELGLEIDSQITLLSRGVVISGHVIPKSEWLRLNGDAIAAEYDRLHPSLGHEIRQGYFKAAETLPPAASDEVEEATKEELPGYVHLRNVTIWSGGQRLNADGERTAGMVWRIRLDELSGYMHGGLAGG